ncbi:MAG TPA: hypothetical protein VF158_15895 [Longimicrobiales bacterium]
MAARERIRLAVRAARRTVAAAARRAWHGAVRLRAELLTSAAFVAGWAFLTWGVAELLVWQVWPLSAGLFFLGLGGWRLLATLVWRGLYDLTRGPGGER